MWGFMYLHDTLTDREGTTYQMAGVIPAECQLHGNWYVWLCGSTTAARAHGEGNSGKTGAGKNKGA